MQNADHEAVKPTTAVLNNSKTGVHAMGLGVSSGLGDIGCSQSSGSSTESDRVGRFPLQNLSEDHSDSEDEKNVDNLWKFERAKKLEDKANPERIRMSKNGRLRFNLVRGGASPPLDDEDDAFQSKSSELTRMISDDDDDDDDNDPNEDQINATTRLMNKVCNVGDINAVQNMLAQSSDAGGTSEGDSYLCLAASAGSYDLCQLLLNCGTNVDDKGRKDNCTALMEAASNGNLQIVELLHKSGADVNARSSAGNSPLHYAACSGREFVVQALLEYGATVDVYNENGHTPLMEAANAGHINTARVLLKAGAGINTHSNEFKETALTLAAYKGHAEMVEFLLKNGACIEHKTDEMHTPLMEAAMDGHMEVAKLLIEAGAKVGMPEDSFESPLTLAACGGHTQMVQLLLAHGASTEEANDENYTPLMEAAREGHLDVVQILLRADANPNAQTHSLETPLSLACKNGHTEIAALLLSCGSNLDHEAEDGQTALMKAARAGHLGTVQFLISKGADINKASRTNDTALSIACGQGHLPVAELLLKSGANPLHRLQDGSTLLIEATRGGHADVVNFLLNWTNPVHYQQVIPDELELSQSSPSQTSLDDQHHWQMHMVSANGCSKQCRNHHHRNQQLLKKSCTHETSRVPIQGLGNVVPPQDPMFYNEAAYNDAAYNDDIQQCQFMKMEQQFAGGDRRMEGCPHAGTDIHCGYHQGLPYSCEESEKNALQSPQESGCSSTDDEDEEEDEDDEEEDEDGDEYEDDDEDENGDGDLDEHDHHLLSKSLIEIKGTMKSTEIPDSLKKAFDGFQNITKAEQLATKQQLLEKLPSLLRKEKFENFTQNPLLMKATKSRNHQHSDSYSSSSEKSVKRAGDGCSDSPQKQQMQNGFALMSGDQKSKQTQRGVVRDQKMSSGDSACRGCNQSHDCQMSDSLVLNLKKKKGLVPKAPPGVHGLDGQHQPPMSLNQWPCDDETSGQPNAKTLYLFEAGQGTSAQQQQMPKRVFAKGNQMFGYDIASAQRKLSKHDSTILKQMTYQRLPESAQLQSCGVAAIQSPEQLALQLELQKQLTLEMGQQQQQQLTDSNSLGLFNSSMGQYAAISGDNVFSPYSEAVKRLQDPIYIQSLQQHQMLYANEAMSLAAAASSQNPDLAARVPGIDKGAQTMMSQMPLHVPMMSQAQNQQLQLIELSQQLEGQGAKGPGNVSYEYMDGMHPSSSRPLSPSGSVSIAPGYNPLMEMVDVQTEVSHDSALSLACVGGHCELVSLLLSRGAKIEIRDKKGLTPLLLAASAGHTDIVELLLSRSAQIEAQSDRTKDTALSLACASGRQEVVELLLKRGANKEHRNVSDYTPLSQAASGGYVNIIRLLLEHSAEINSRTGSKLGISPLMLAAMNGHTESVLLLLEKGGDVNAHIETNRNTALTLACFQGRHEVVAVLADRKANLEHRAKTGLTPLMEAATGGYVEVGRVLVEKGADVAAAPVPSSRDTALTIAADKGHSRFVELLLQSGSPIDVKNKKGATALWLACNGGHLEVVQSLVREGADFDSQDNRKLSCIVAAFRKGHTKVVRWLVKYVTQFPNDLECMRYISDLTDAELRSRCEECKDVIMTAKKRQEEEAEKNADSLLQELQQEKSLVEKKRAARERKREKKRQKKKEKTFSAKESLRLLAEGDSGAKMIIDEMDMKDDDYSDEGNGKRESADTTTGKNGILKKENKKCAKVRKTKSRSSVEDEMDAVTTTVPHLSASSSNSIPPLSTSSVNASDVPGKAKISSVAAPPPLLPQLPPTISSQSFASVADPNTRSKRDQVKPGKGFAATGIGDLDDFSNPDDMRMSAALPSITAFQTVVLSRPEVKLVTNSSIGNRPKATVQSTSVVSSKSTRSGGTTQSISRSVGNSTQKKGQKKDENWKDPSKKMRKIDVPARAVSRVIGRAGCNINAIREHTLARIDLDKLKTSDDAIVTIRGLTDQVNQAAELILGLIRESDKDIDQLIAALKSSNGNGQSRYDSVPSSSSWKNMSKAANSTTSAWESGTLNVWENRSMKGTNAGSGSASMASSSSVDSKPANVWSRTNKEPAAASDLNVTSSNVWDNSMADGIGLGGGAAAVGAKPSVSSGTIGSGKPPLQLGKQDSLDQQQQQQQQLQQRTAATDDYSKPQPIRSFPIGAWTPIRGQHNSTVSPLERIVPFASHPSQQNLNPDATSVANGMNSEAMSYIGAKAELMKSVSLGSEEAAFDGNGTKQPTVVSYNRAASSGEGQAPDGRTMDSGEQGSAPSMPVQFQMNPAIPEKMRHQFQEMSIGEYLPFNNHFSPLAETVIPKKGQNSGRMAFHDMSGPRMGAEAVIDIALQAKAPGYRPPGQVQRTISSPGLQAGDASGSSFQTEVKAPSMHSDSDRNSMLTPASYNRATDRSPGGAITSDYSPFSEGIEKASKLMTHCDDGYSGLLPQQQSNKQDAYITTQSPMMLPRISSSLNPDAPNFTIRPFIYKHQASPYDASMFSAPNYRLPLNQLHAPGMAALHHANGFIANSAVKDHMISHPMGLSGNIDPSLMRRFSLDESSPSGPQMVPAAAPSVSNPPSPSEDGQSHPMVMGEERRLMLRPIGTERTNKRPNSMTGSSGVMPPGAGDLQQWPFSQGSGDWQRHGYMGGAPMPLGMIPNLPPDMIPQMSSSSSHLPPAMIGQLPLPQQKILAINNAMYDPSLQQIRPGYLVPNGMTLSFGGGAMGPGAMAPHPPLQFSHLPPPSPAPERSAMENAGNWTSGGMNGPSCVDGSAAAATCHEERLRTWNIWNSPSNL